MGKLQSTITSEIIRLSSRETRKVLVPLRKDVRQLKGTLSQLRKSVSELQRFMASQEKLRPKELGILAGVSIGAVQMWEKGKFRPKDDKMAVLVGLRKMGRSGARRLLEQRAVR